MLNDYGYIEKAIANIKEVAEKQEANIKAAATRTARICSIMQTCASMTTTLSATRW